MSKHEVVTDMRYDEAVRLARIAGEEHREISAEVAHVIAMAWHGGQASPSYSFASTGAIHAPYTSTDIWRSCAGDYSTASAPDRIALDALGTYLLNDAPHVGDLPDAQEDADDSDYGRW